MSSCLTKSCIEYLPFIHSRRERSTSSERLSSASSCRAQLRSNRQTVPLRMQCALPVACYVCVATVSVATCAPEPTWGRNESARKHNSALAYQTHGTLRRELRDGREALHDEAGGEERSGLRDELQHSAATRCNTVQAGVEELGVSSQSKIKSPPRSVPTLYAMLEFKDWG